MAYKLLHIVIATDLAVYSLYWGLLRECFSTQVNYRKYPKLKEVDDVLGGAAAWENVDSTAGMLY